MPVGKRKATDELIDAAEHWLARGFLKGEIKRLLAAQHAKAKPNDPTVSPRTLETVITAARARLLAAADRDREELRAESLAFYEEMARRTDVATRERLRARECIDRLLGLAAPLRHEHSGTVTTAPSDLSKLSDAELAAYRAMLAKMTPAAAPPTP